MKQKHDFRLGEYNLTLIAKNVQEYDTPSKRNKNENHSTAEALKCIQFSLLEVYVVSFSI